MTPFFLSELKVNLIRLCWIRAVLLTVLGGLLYYAYWQGMDLVYGKLTLLLMVSSLVIGISYWRLSLLPQKEVSAVEFLIHLLTDSMILCAFLYLSGGATNPLVSLLLIHLTVAAALLPTAHTTIIAIFSLSAYTALLFFYTPVQVFSTHHSSGGINPHIAGMWFTFALSAALITYIVSRMAKTVRDKEQRLQLYRENTLRDEQLLAVATLAAATAHDLGTPLSTMRTLLAELEISSSEDEDLHADIQLLTSQVDRCKQILQN